MTCAEFETLVQRVFEGALAPGLMRDVERHAARCEACGELLRFVLDGHRPPSLSSRERDDLTGGILERTAGRTCARVEELLAQGAGGAIDGEDDGLVRAHLRHCRGCAALAGALQTLSTGLSELAEMEPGPRFVEDVLARTIRSAPSTRRIRSATAWWSREIRRSRFPAELAYSMAMLIFLILQIPGAPRTTPARGAGAAAVDPAAAVAGWWAGSAGVRGEVGEVGRAVWEETAVPVSRRGGRQLRALGSTAGRIGGVVSIAATYGKRIGVALLRTDVVEGWRLASEARKKIVERWREGPRDEGGGDGEAAGGEP